MSNVPRRLCWVALSMPWVVLMASCCCWGDGGSVPQVRLPREPGHPFIACTAGELARLRAAYGQSGPAHDLLAGLVSKAEKALTQPLRFPPRGGQHNQWYQCGACQTALRMLDESHHQCPRCGRIYSGPPYDDVIFSRVHSENLSNLQAAAWAYAVAGDRRFADYAAQVLRGYAQRYAAYPYHANDAKEGNAANKTGGHLYEQTLTEASAFATRIAPAYDLIHDSGALSAEDHQAIREGLIRPMLENIAKHRAGKSNWQTWHNAAMVWGGALLGEEAWVQRALGDPNNGFAFQMKASVTAEGMWYENSWGYHLYTLQALVATAEGCRRLGIDLWSDPMLHRMFTLPVRYTMPDGSLPRFGDAVNDSAAGQPALMACAAKAYGDPALAALASSKPTLESILLGLEPTPSTRPAIEGSEVFPGAGHAILRSQGEAGLTAAMTFGPYGGFHGHFDKLSFVLFGRGRELGVDPGRAASQAYRLPIHSHWYKATLSHNAVVVDGASQQPAAGKLDLFATTPSYAAALASCTEAYPGVRQRRLLLATPRYLVVLDELQSDPRGPERRFDWVYHHRGTAVQCDVADHAGELGEHYNGGEYVQNLREGRSAKMVAVEFTGTEGDLSLLMDGQEQTEVRTGDGPGQSVADRVPLAMLTRRGRLVRFAAVLEPLAKGQRRQVESVELRPADAGVEVLIRCHGTVDRLLMSAGGSLQFSSGDAVVLKGP